jgi:16S rRNA G966 N2-methylase RsmD
MSNLFFEDKKKHIKLYNGNCFQILDDLKKTNLKFNMIFADPPYFLSNDGITCHSGKMVTVNKGKWDKTKGHEENLNFNLENYTLCEMPFPTKILSKRLRVIHVRRAQKDIWNTSVPSDQKILATHTLLRGLGIASISLLLAVSILLKIYNLI